MPAFSHASMPDDPLAGGEVAKSAAKRPPFIVASHIAGPPQLDVAGDVTLRHGITHIATEDLFCFANQ